MSCQRIDKHHADFMKPIKGMELLISHHCPKILVRKMCHLKKVINNVVEGNNNCALSFLFADILEEQQIIMSNSSEYRTEEEKEGQTHSSHTDIDYLLAEASGSVIKYFLSFQYTVQFLMKFLNSCKVPKSTVFLVFNPCPCH